MSVLTSKKGHPLHSMCSYMAMFPPTVPHAFIDAYTSEGDVVLDPFSGRGTTPLEACLMGRVGVGNDLNPMSFVLTKAKTLRVEPQSIMARLRMLEDVVSLAPAGAYKDLAPGKELSELRTKMAQQHSYMPHFASDKYLENADSKYVEVDHHPIWIFYHPEVLRVLSRLKSVLTTERHWWAEDVFITATILGIMHGNGRFYLSVPMPNTFSMSPNYVVKFTREKQLKLPYRNVLQAVRDKIALMDLSSASDKVEGEAFYGDVRRLPDLARAFLGSVNLVVTSPPYLKVVKYGMYNWIRLWFLDGHPLGNQAGWTIEDGVRLDRRVDRTLDDEHKLSGYLQFLRESLVGVRPLLADRAVLAFAIGDVAQKDGTSTNLADQVRKNVTEPLGFRTLHVQNDFIAENKKVTKIWGDTKGKATKVDRILVFSL